MACSVAQREQTSGSVKCVKKMPLRNGPSTSPPRRIVRIVNCGDNAWDEARKVIVLVGSVPCAVSCPVLHLCSQILIFSEPCSRSSTSPHVGGSLAQAICRGDPARSDPQEPCSSSSPTPCGAFALPLELVRPARTQCVVGTSPTAHHGCWRSCILASN